MRRWWFGVVAAMLICWPVAVCFALRVPLPESVEAEWTAGFKTAAPMDGDTLSDEKMITNEGRLKGSLFWAGDSFAIYATPEIRVNDGFSSRTPGGETDYSDGLTLRRNLTLSNRFMEISFRELYLEKEMLGSRFRVGNQVFSWGTADLINPTSWVNPQDLRLLFLKEEDAITQGVPAISMLRFFDAFALEAAVVPVSISRLQSEEGNYFHVMPDNFTLPIHVDANEPAPVTFENMGVAARLTGSLGACDLSVSAYRGPDREPLILPIRVATPPGKPVFVDVEPSHHAITGVGGDLSWNVGEVVVQVEGAYTFDKRGYVNQDVSQPADVAFPYPVVHSGYWDISAGFNWFVPTINWFPNHEGETVFTLEGHGSGYTEHGLMEPLYSRSMVARFQDSFWASRVPVSLSYMADIKKEGEIVWGSVGYDFMNGMVVEASIYLFGGHAPAKNTVGSPFWYLRNRDLISVGLTYVF